jgi:bis(5'-nucleosyl)-tetraphosphatase (symmetrical)
MAIYAIGDVQGCDAQFGALLASLKFSADRDRLWLVGDLVNRGPDSLKVLRRVRSLGQAASVVLGNHDLHLLAVGLGCARTRTDDTLEETLAAPDRDALLDWLVGRPLMHEEADLHACMVHAGLAPQWDLREARQCAAEFENALRRDPVKLLGRLYGDEPDRWDPSLAGEARLRFIVNCFTRLRYVDADGRLALKVKGSPKKAHGKSLTPWFEFPTARWRGTRIVFGHWSTLGFFRNEDVTALDTGCVWGDRLTALRLDVPDAEPVHVACALPGAP